MKVLIQASNFARMAEVNPYEQEQPMRVEYEYYEGEATIFWPTERAHPGTPPSVQLLSCRIGGVECIDMLHSDQVETIEEAILRITED